MPYRTEHDDESHKAEWVIVAQYDGIEPGKLVPLAIIFLSIAMVYELFVEGVSALGMLILICYAWIGRVLLERETVKCIWIDGKGWFYVQTVCDRRQGRRFSVRLSADDIELVGDSIRLVHAKRTICIPLTPDGRQKFA